MPDVLVRLARLLRRLRVERLLSGGRLRDGDERVAGDDEVDLLVVEPVLRRHLDRQQQDPEHVIAVRLDARARLVVVDVRLEERGDRGRVDALRKVRAQLVFGRVDEVDPLRASLGHTTRLARSAGRSDLGGFGCCRGAWMTLERCEELLGVEGCHAARSRRGDCLAVGVVLDVAGREHARHVRLGRAGMRDEVAVAVVVELVDEQRGVGIVADRDEEAVGRRPPRSRRSRCCEAADPRPLASPRISSTTVLRMKSSLSFASARSTMILDARNSSRRCTRCTRVANLVRKSASSNAESPPPTT